MKQIIKCQNYIEQIPIDSNNIWNIFSELLNAGIYIISSYESYDGFIYSGLNNVYFNENIKNYHVFPSFQSFTIDKSIAIEFRGNKGCIIVEKLTPNNRATCDVSWISLFEDEKEILYQRGFPIDTLRRNNITIIESETDNNKTQWICHKMYNNSCSLSKV